MTAGALERSTGLTTLDTAGRPLSRGSLTTTENQQEALAEARALLRLAAEELKHLREVQWGWDGRRARPVTPTAAERAQSVLAQLWSDVSFSNDRTWPDGVYLRPQSFVLPRGGVQLEWNTADVHVAVTVDADGVAIFSVVIPAEGVDLDVDTAPGWPSVPAPAVRALVNITKAVWDARPTSV